MFFQFPFLIVLFDSFVLAVVDNKITPASNPIHSWVDGIFKTQTPSPFPASDHGANVSRPSLS